MALRAEPDEHVPQLAQRQPGVVGPAAPVDRLRAQRVGGER
jgi:hypothetical protein